MFQSKLGIDIVDYWIIVGWWFYLGLCVCAFFVVSSEL